ncbi:MAG: YkvA family protein [Runella sp.]
MPSAPTSDSLLMRILKSVFYRKATGKAGRYVRNTDSLLGLLKEVMAKTKNLKGDTYDTLRDKVSLLVRLTKAYTSGQYRVIPWKSLTLIVTVLVYFLSPIDLIPDLLPVVGLTDDVALLVWLFNTINDDLEAFREWDKQRNTIVLEP